MSEHDFIIGFLNEKHVFDVFAKIRNVAAPNYPAIALYPSEEDARTIVNGMLHDGIIAKYDEEYHITGGKRD